MFSSFMTLVESYGKLEWIKHWAGDWSLLSCSYFGHQYTKTIKETLGACLQKAMFVSKEDLVFVICISWRYWNLENFWQIKLLRTKILVLNYVMI